MLTAWLPPRSLDGNDTVSGMDTITRAKGGCAGGRGALLTVSQLLSQPALQWLLWQWWWVGDFVFQDAWEKGDNHQVSPGRLECSGLAGDRWR